MEEKLKDFIVKIDYNFTESEKQVNILNYRAIFNKGMDYELKSSIFKNSIQVLENRINACYEYYKIICCVNKTDFNNLDNNDKTNIITKSLFVDCLIRTGTLIIIMVEDLIKELRSENKKIVYCNSLNVSLFNKAIYCITYILQFDNINVEAKKKIVDLYLFLSKISEPNYDISFYYLETALLYVPEDPSLHYMMGHIYSKKNELEKAISHLKLSIYLNIHTDNKVIQDNIYINAYNLLSLVYRDLQLFPTCVTYLEKANEVDPTHPDINNTFGLVYIDIKRYDLAEQKFQISIENYKKSYNIGGVDDFLASIYSNLGLVHFLNGDNKLSMEFNSKSLKVNPILLTFQNQMLSLINEFIDFDNKLVIKEQHSQINKFFLPLKENDEIIKRKYTFDSKFFSESKKINVGIVSSDFKNHVVFYFISSYLECFDHTKFTLTCYLETLNMDSIQLNSDNIQYKCIKNMPVNTVSNMIYEDNIHILIDLNGNTANNRLDVFSLKPSPIQVSYLGYPYSSGLNEIDYRITDSICDNKDISQKLYSEKLLFMKDCFLCFNKKIHIPEEIELLDAPYYRNRDMLTIGCFSRADKLNHHVISFYNEILLNNDKVRIVFKSRSFMIKIIMEKFINKFNEKVRDRIEILPYCKTTTEHIYSYNHIDIAIDSFPYSGTTTCCESLYMGVPMFTLYDNEHFFHAQNVSSSILKNSHQDFDFYILNKKEEIHDKIKILQKKPTDFWKHIKGDTQIKFLHGNVSKKERYTKNLEEIFLNLYTKHSNEVNPIVKTGSGSHSFPIISKNIDIRNTR